MSQQMASDSAQRETFRESSRAWWRSVTSTQELGVFLVLIVMILFLSWQTDTFTSSNNIRNITLSFSWIAIAAFGQILVIISGGIDLSTGSIMAASGLAAAWLISGSIEGEPTSWVIEKMVNGRGMDMGPDKYVPIALLAGPLMGLFLGTINGLLVAWANLPAFIATLGMMSVARGFVYGLSGGWPLQKLNNEFLKLGQNDLPLFGYDLPYPFIIMVLIAIMMTFFLSRTTWGYRIYAVGGNEQAARLSGVNTRRVKLMAFMLSGLMAGIGGTLMTSRLAVAAPTAAQGYELDVIAAVFIGGASVTGGKGTIIGTVIGAAIMQVLRTGLNLLGANAYWQPAAIGFTIILAVMFDRARNNPRIGEEFRNLFGRSRAKDF
ncbi:ABC transporter permease [Aggregatilinea lenta]|uniref:ABC transporter permease n=1 Tax=Aggregatilinea lenta TaxID=913108 RepID=UPI001EE8534F|nr:ABC transporter permease [Aggregatilinea lenta]